MGCREKEIQQEHQGWDTKQEVPAKAAPRVAKQSRPRIQGLLGTLRPAPQQSNFPILPSGACVSCFSARCP